MLVKYIQDYDVTYEMASKIRYNRCIQGNSPSCLTIFFFNKILILRILKYIQRQIFLILEFFLTTQGVSRGDTNLYFSNENSVFYSKLYNR